MAKGRTSPAVLERQKKELRIEKDRVTWGKQSCAAVKKKWRGEKELTVNQMDVCVLVRARVRVRDYPKPEMEEVLMFYSSKSVITAMQCRQ